MLRYISLRILRPYLLGLLGIYSIAAQGQTVSKPLDTLTRDAIARLKEDTLQADSVNRIRMEAYQKRLAQVEAQRQKDSITQEKLRKQLARLRESQQSKREKIQRQLDEINEREAGRQALMRQRIDSLRAHVVGFPVLGPDLDTLFLIYSHLGPFSALDRAKSATDRIRSIYRDDTEDFHPDSMRLSHDAQYYTIEYQKLPLLSISELDGIWNSQLPEALARHYAGTIGQSIAEAREANSLLRWFVRIGLVLGIALGLILFILLLGWLHRLIRYRLTKRLRPILKDARIRTYTLVSRYQKVKILHRGLNIFRWLIICIAVYISLLLTFSVFPFTRSWAARLFELLWTPFYQILLGIWHYLPNVFTILIIVLVTRYILRLVRYFFKEIKTGKLRINRFHQDWAMPTYNIVRILLYAFMFIMIFPYLPGSDSGIFKGVSVFLGILFSLGSSSAIANLVAGLVITYMRPFKIGDRIRIGDISGDVIEKSMLVIRLKTAKNEEITLPNSSVLSSNTINYNTHAHKEGLILHTTVTIGYDVPWPKVQEALIEAGRRTHWVCAQPQPFVLQTALDDFYVAYELNVYTRVPNKMGGIYSELHAHIQTVFAERNIEIMSPHYRANREDTGTTIPSEIVK